ncbi:hypothetical protein MMC13_000650 [Lambiella insularis]|nr:hypothetical protein [Lambiella insularis]
MDTASTLNHSFPSDSATPDGASGAPSEAGDAPSTRIQHAATHNSASREAIARETNRAIRSKLRDDWDWPQMPSQHTRVDHDTAWRGRYSGASSPSSSPSSPNPYRFDTPDSIAFEVESRRRTRGVRLLEEMRWNDGLRTYITRRNDWTGGTFASELPQSAGSLSHSRPPLPRDDSVRPASIEIVPLPSPLIPLSNIIRSGISPASYSAIYNKVIVEGVSPKIPINLADMTKAIVSGWKASGEWPPLTQHNDQPPVVRPKGRYSLLSGLDASGLLPSAEGSRGKASKGVGRVKKALGLAGNDLPASGLR